MYICRYCKDIMYGQDNDYMGNGLYSKIYACSNNECKAVYEEWIAEKGRSVSERNRWFNPKTKEFEK